MENSIKHFAQVPANVFLDPGLTHFEKLFISISYYHRFLGTNNLTVSSFSNCLGVTRDHARKLINRAGKSLFVQNYISVSTIKQGLNLEDFIVIKFKETIPDKITIKKNQTEEHPAFLDALTKVLKSSKYFNGYTPIKFVDLFEGIEINELIKGIYYVEKREVKNPIAYLKTCFINQKFRYQFDQKPTIKPEIINKKNIRFGVTITDLEKLKNILGTGFVVIGAKYQDQNFALIQSIEKAGRPRNVEQILIENQIPFNYYDKDNGKSY